MTGSPPPRRARLPFSVLGAAAMLGTAAAAVAAVYQSLFRYYQVDEYVFVRCAWLVGEGAVPYRDFFDHHTPLFSVLLAPFVKLAGPSAAALDAARLAALVLLATVFWLVWRLARRFGGRDGAWLAVFLLATLHAFVARGIEVRPDLLATAAFLGAAELAFGGGGRRRGVAAGVLSAAAVLSTQKALYYLWGLGLLALIDAVRAAGGRRGAPWLGVPTGSLLAGFAAAVAAAAGTLLAAGALGNFWQQNVTLAIEWQATPRRFPALDYLLPALRQAPHWAVGVVLGSLALAAGGPARERLDRRQWTLYAALAAPALLSLAINPTPWPYNFLPVFAILTPLAAPLAGRARELRPLPRLLTATGLLLLAVAAYLPRLLVEAERGQTPQRQALATALRVTAPDLPVFDANGGYLFRPAAYRYWYHSAAMRDAMRERLEREMVPSILAAGAPAAIVDFRFSDLPPTVRHFVQWSYQRYDGALFLWGSAYRTTAGADGPERFSFRAIRDGDYFLQTEAPGDAGVEVRIDGRVVAPRQPVPLAAGEHAVEATHPAGAGEPTSFFLLWRPPTGELWQPLPGPPPDYYPFRPGDPQGWLATAPRRQRSAAR